MILMLISNMFQKKNETLSKVGLIFKKANLAMDLEFFVNLMDMYQLDFYLAIFLQLDDFKVRSKLSGVNLFLSLLFLGVFMFTKVVLLFKSGRVASIKSKGVMETKGYKKYYYDYLFLSRDNHGKNFYSHHQSIMNLFKDPILSILLVFCSKIPLLQIGGVLLVVLSFFMLEVAYRPATVPIENFRKSINNGLYSLTNSIFFVLATVDKKITYDQRENFIGWPLIGSVVLLVLCNYYISFKLTIKMIRERCKKRKSNQVKPSEKESKVLEAKKSLDNSEMSIINKSSNKVHMSNSALNIRKKSSGNPFSEG
jgi:hypothetical protein